MRRVLAVGVAALVVSGVVVAPAGAVGAVGSGGGPEADLAYHGVASMAGGRVDVRFTPRNHGPSDVPDATVRLRWSAPLANGQVLPGGCARSGPRVVLCRVGALAADDLGAPIGMRVRLKGAPSEVLLELDTVWSGGAVDHNRANDQQRVLVLDSGDEYYF
ncbi:hypothetical protein [Streptomyces pseudovenezuelae]|uniref:Secreted protein n=1 Tax=Streptomyces pseudovenezuelae TaxID=67350 RepID=A0ABT6LPT0_9ACTN|nr:hypothetical protein [Streptomyces pseudovenezuelae]MDH6217834.1 hypothetical protein [Streptomyces pseudovenezuelae]